MLGPPEFITYIKDTYISGKSADKNIPALKELIHKISVEDIFERVEEVFGQNQVLSRNVKIYLCKKYTVKPLSEIWAYFNIGDSGVSKVYGRLSQRIEKDKKLKSKINKIIKSLNLSNVQT